MCVVRMCDTNMYTCSLHSRMNVTLPNRQYLGILFPTIPATTMPLWQPSLIRTCSPFFSGLGSGTKAVQSRMSRAMSMIFSAWFFTYKTEDSSEAQGQQSRGWRNDGQQDVLDLERRWHPRRSPWRFPPCRPSSCRRGGRRCRTWSWASPRSSCRRICRRCRGSRARRWTRSSLVRIPANVMCVHLLLYRSGYQLSFDLTSLHRVEPWLDLLGDRLGDHLGQQFVAPRHLVIQPLHRLLHLLRLLHLRLQSILELVRLLRTFERRKFNGHHSSKSNSFLTC